MAENNTDSRTAHRIEVIRETARAIQSTDVADVVSQCQWEGRLGGVYSAEVTAALEGFEL